ncbi:MAG: GIN domain-containing protein [Candidatus Muiribacteriota bacterium]
MNFFYKLFSRFNSGIKGNKKIASKKITLNNIKNINAMCSYSILLLNTDETPELKIETDENLLEYIEVKQDDEKVILNTTENIKPSSGVVKFIFKTNSIEKVVLNGAGKFESNFNSDNKMSFTLNGSGKINLTGNLPKAKVILNGAGKYFGENLECEKFFLEINGSGKAKVGKCRKLTLKGAGVGKIEYTGNPEIKKKLTGIIKIKRSGK